MAAMDTYGSPAHCLIEADDRMARMAVLGQTKGPLGLMASLYQWPMIDAYRRVERQGKYAGILS